MIIEATHWRSPPSSLELRLNTVHIWRSSLLVPDKILDSLYRLLSDDERKQAQRYIFAHDCRRSIVSRGVLRILLGAYAKCPAQELVFEYEPRGKPFVIQQADATPIVFNLSHTHEWVVYGFTLQRRIGIDIEYHRDLRAMASVASTIFSAHELAAWQAVPAQQKRSAFYAGWTRKEAFVKALGDGLSFPLKQFDVSLAPSKKAQILRLRDHPTTEQQWHLTAFAPAETISGAVVVEGSQPDFMFWEFCIDR